MEGKLIIFSAPSGSGKSTIINYLLTQGLNLAFSISATSRPPRGTEKHGVEYFFLTPDEFRKRIDDNEFLEYEEVYKDRYYGTLKSQVEEQLKAGQNVIFDVDVVGGCNIKKYYGDKYYSIGFQVGKGTFTQESAGYFSKLIALPLSKPPYNSFEHLALSTKESYFYYPSKYMDDGIVELLVIPRMARYQRQYQFHSVKNWCDAYVFIQESTPLKNVTTGEFETMFKQFLRIKELIKELKANEEQYN